jgi:hypothetical protein
VYESELNFAKPTPRNNIPADIRSTQPVTSTVGTRSGVASSGRSTIAMPGS